MTSSEGCLRGRELRALLAALVAGTALAAGRAAADACAPWPGEPEPLPSRASPEPIRARWAALRAIELGAHARRLEAAVPLEAHRLWRRVLCFDPQSIAARTGLARTRAVQVHRLEVASANAPPPPEDPWIALASPVTLGAVTRSREPAPGSAAAEPGDRAAARARILSGIDRVLDDAEAKLRAARFREASDAATQARSRIDGMRRGPELSPRMVRLEVLDATARLALGEEGAARESLRRALRSDPDLTLDPRTTSPKVLRALEAARRAEEVAP